MRSINDMIAELHVKVLNEEELAALLNELKECGRITETRWIGARGVWQAELSGGNELFYYGEGLTMQESILEALNDYVLAHN